MTGILEAFYKVCLMIGATLGIVLALERIYILEPNTPIWIGATLVVVAGYLFIGGAWKFVLANVRGFKQEIEK